MIRLALALLLICGMPAGAAERPASPVLQFRDWLWPHRAPEAPLPPPRPPIIELPAPPAPPPVSKTPPGPEKPPAPAAKPKRPIDKSGEKIDKPKPKPVKRAVVAPGVCDQIRGGIAMIGRSGVIAEARRRGYSQAQISQAIAACGL